MDLKLLSRRILLLFQKLTNLIFHLDIVNLTLTLKDVPFSWSVIKEMAENASARLSISNENCDYFICSSGNGARFTGVLLQQKFEN